MQRSTPAGQAAQQPLVERVKSQAIDTYVGLRKSFWGDLSPRAGINIPNQRLNAAVNQAAVSFWTAVARRNRAFSSIYGHSGSSPSLPTASRAARPRQWASPASGAATAAVAAPAALAASGSLTELIADARRYGVARLEDVLPDRQFQVARRDFERVREAPTFRVGDGVRCHSCKPSSAFRELFREITLAVTRELFGVAFCPPRDRFGFVQRIELEGRDRNDSNSILHIDRFVPSIKIFYYPHAITSVEMSPFGFVPESHIINDDYLDAVRESHRTRPYGSKPFEIRNTTGNPEIPVLVDGNSLLLAYTNGLHRRMPFSDQVPLGSYREAACFMFYNLYTRGTLLRRALLP